MGFDSGFRILQDFVPRFRSLFGVLLFALFTFFPGFGFLLFFIMINAPLDTLGDHFCFARAAESPLPWPRLPPGFAVTVAAF